MHKWKYTMFPQGKSEFLEIAADKTESLIYYSITYPVFDRVAITCSKLTIETLEQGVKFVQS